MFVCFLDQKGFFFPVWTRKWWNWKNCHLVEGCGRTEFPHTARPSSLFVWGEHKWQRRHAFQLPEFCDFQLWRLWAGLCDQGRVEANAVSGAGQRCEFLDGQAQEPWGWPMPDSAAKPPHFMVPSQHCEDWLAVFGWGIEPGYGWWTTFRAPVDLHVDIFTRPNSLAQMVQHFVHAQYWNLMLLDPGVFLQRCYDSSAALCFDFGMLPIPKMKPGTRFVLTVQLWKLGNPFPFLP